MQVRISSPNDLTGILNLFNRSGFIQDIQEAKDPKGLLNWLFFRVDRTANYALVAGDTDLMGFYGCVPSRFSSVGQESNAGLGSMLVIDPKYRHGGLFLKLQQAYLTWYPDRQIDFIYALVNRPQILALHLKTGYSAIGEAPVLAYPVRSASLVGRPLGGLLDKYFAWKLKEVKNGSWAVQEEQDFSFLNDESVQGWLKPFRFHAVRDRRELQNRFFGFSGRQYTVLSARRQGLVTGYMVLRVMPMRKFQVCAIVDTLWDKGDRKTPRVLAGRAYRIARNNGCDLLASLFLADSTYAAVLKRMGFLKTPEKFTLVYSCKGKKLLAVEGSTAKDWHISWFDHDTV